jgi:2-polyprenyl-3-methyl-5-hydroxy-6-metoxy-1,4-benzoquinol methylase
MNSDKITFSFGKNWKRFIEKNFDEEIVNISKKHILDFLEMADLTGKYFLDIGCGSGLSSLAAFRANARKVVSFDADLYSVRTTEILKKMCDNPTNWEILHGSILDTNFLTGVERADIVYAWGVLHHTGNMWKAIENTVSLSKKGGLIYLALYTTDRHSEYWLEIKKRYNRASGFMKRVMEFKYILRYAIVPNCVRFKNPLTAIASRKKERGMSYFTDVRDWLGGYPFEHARIEEVFHFCTRKLSLELVNIKTGRLNTEYLFTKQ